MTSINFAAAATSEAGAETSLGGVVGVASGAFSFDLVVASDDPDEAMYTITVTGTADDMVPSDADAGTVGGADAGTDPGDGNSDSGCGCSTGPGGTSSANWLWFALLGLFLVTRRRRHTS